MCRAVHQIQEQPIGLYETPFHDENQVAHPGHDDTELTGPKALTWAIRMAINVFGNTLICPSLRVEAKS
jgi:hypothetical protein